MGHAAKAFAVLRIVTGLLVAAHGVRKLIAGPAATIGKAIEAQGLSPAPLFAWMITLGELCGILLALGLFTRYAGLAVAATMGAITFAVHRNVLIEKLGTGPAVQGEFPLLLGVVALVFAIAGPMAWAVRHK